MMSDTGGEVTHTVQRLLAAEARLKYLEDHATDPHVGSGSGSGGSSMDAWQTSVENRLASLDSRLDLFRSEMSSNFRWTWGGLATGVLAVLGAFAGGFLYLSNKIDTSVIALIERIPTQ